MEVEGDLIRDWLQSLRGSEGGREGEEGREGGRVGGDTMEVEYRVQGT